MPASRPRSNASRRRQAGEYRIAGIPNSPGFENYGPPRMFVYPLTEAMRKQLEAIAKRE